jgi:hypothetical protein
LIVFDEAEVRRAVTAFRRARGIDDTPATVVDRLDRAIDISALKGPDPRWRSIPFWAANDDPGDPPFGYAFKGATTDVGQTVLDRVLEIEGRRRGNRSGLWMDAHAVLSASRWARFSLAMRDAHYAGLGWLVPVHGELILVPMPAVRTAEGRPNVLHDDTGRPAVEWMDGSGSYFLHGLEVDKRTYTRVVGGELLIQEIATLPTADLRSMALTYLSFERLVIDSDAELIDTGVRGTRLYRLPLPFRIRADRIAGYGDYDYFIHMRDASHPEREFVEWVEPAIGSQRNAELCQARAFGITLAEWLSIDQEG